MENNNLAAGEEGTDEEGNGPVLALERKSVQPYKTQDEYLYAMKEDLAEWLNALYNINVTEENFFEELETGVLICRHANLVRDFILKNHCKSLDGKTRIELPENGVQFKENVKAGSFQCRDNISNFITWCRRLGKLIIIVSLNLRPVLQSW